MTDSNRQYADIDATREVERFLLKEARLLDWERWDEWLGTLSEEIHYWMPGIENRRREDKLGQYTREHMAYFDDGLRDLNRRIERFKQPSAWAENPQTRNVHIVTNIEVFNGENEGEYEVHSCIYNVRSRGLDEEYKLAGRREDIIRREEGELKLYRRKILIPNASLLFKNLNTFL
ncbi:MAG: 3-phenylpropionate/cinnamic acid dioxygenase subunit beta [Xanthomonadaceae bacterium]|nr:3-phenylpropionate/cinnamic acid dioxygenase subunit beta [Xanthomonadaceae bacterium]